MTSAIPAGPFDYFQISGNKKAPFYLIPFDKKGRCEGPLTRAELLRAVASGEFTDIHIFSHGWNNIFKEALERYRSFFTGYLTIRANSGLDNVDDYRPLFVGIVWPSTALVLPWEKGPDIAGADGRDQIMADEQFALRELASDLPDNQLSRFYEFSQRGRTLTPAEGLEFAEILLSIFQCPDTELRTAENVTANDLLTVWQQTADKSSTDESGEGGYDPDEMTPSTSGPSAAGVLDYLDPRNAIRVATVWQMKDRAGTVGAFGVGPMLQDIIKEKAKNTRVHLMGHSYGAKVVLSALCYPSSLSGTVTSLLLLQPAISYLCFGKNIDGNGTNGGYREALKRTDRPIFTTFSKNDAPLTKFFHLAVRRNSDLGDQKIAGIPPSKFAALGGFGPGGMLDGESTTEIMPAVGTKYSMGEAKIFGIDGSSDKIKGHGDVSNEFTEWALVNLVSREKLP
jgi:hypothetical protein